MSPSDIPAPVEREIRETFAAPDPEAASAPVTETEPAAPGEPEPGATAEAPVEAAEQVEEPPKESVAPKIAEHVRNDSAQVLLTEPSVFMAEPYNLTEDELFDVLIELRENDEFRDIVSTEDERTGEIFMHSEVLITVPYAQLMLRKRADDPIYLIVATVRDESRIYPRSTAASYFEFEPFNLRLEDVLVNVEEILADEQYSDIHVVKPSNGATYLYSDRYYDEVNALAHAQWVEVDMHLPGNQ